MIMTSKNPVKGLVIVLCAGLVALISCSSEPEDSELQRLVSYLTCSFENFNPADITVSCPNVRIQMTRIWSDSSEGCWLLGEKTSLLSPHQPLEQWVSHIRRSKDSVLVWDEYVFIKPTAFAGVWRRPDLLLALQRQDLAQKAGCSVILRAESDSAFVGNTVGTDCLRTRPTGNYETTEIRVDESRFYRWVRSFDAEGKQTRGAPSCDYAYRKVVDLKEPKQLEVLAKQFNDIGQRARAILSTRKVRIVLDKSSDVMVTTYNYNVYGSSSGSTTAPKFDYDPEEHIIACLRQAGFDIVRSGIGKADEVRLEVTYEENRRGRGLDASPTVYFSFRVRHGTAGLLLSGGDPEVGFSTVTHLKNDPQFKNLGDIVRSALEEFVVTGRAEKEAGELYAGAVSSERQDQKAERADEASTLATPRNEWGDIWWQQISRHRNRQGKISLLNVLVPKTASRDQIMAMARHLRTEFMHSSEFTIQIFDHYYQDQDKLFDCYVAKVKHDPASGVDTVHWVGIGRDAQWADD